MKKLSPRLFFSAGMTIPIALVGFAVVLSAVYQVAACPLCIAQRMLFLVIALLGGIGLATSTVPLWRFLVAASMVVTGTWGAVIAGYQIYLQHHPFAATCGGGGSWWERLVEQAGQIAPILFKAEGLCSDTSWGLFGLSIVHWSFLSFVGLALIALAALLISPSRSRT